MGGRLLRKNGGRLLAALLATASPLATAEAATMHLAPKGDWAQKLPEQELAELRGGFFGIAFSVFFNGFFDNLGNAQGSLEVDTGGATAPPPEFSTSDGQVRISTVIGDFQGATGLFQIAQVPGSFNIVNNNLFVQVAVINVLDSTAIPSLTSLFDGLP